MNDPAWSAVDDYVSEKLVGEDAILTAALVDSAAAGLPPINVAPNQGVLLMMLAQTVGARRVLEIGTLGGYSTIWLARGLVPGGKLVTLEFEPAHAAVATKNLARAGLGDVVEVRVGPAVQSLQQLIDEQAGPFDLVFIDADKESYADYFAFSIKLTRPGSVIVADNVIRDGRVIDPSDPDPRVQGVRRLFDAIAAEPRVTASALQTVGAKGYDGFVICRVNRPNSLGVEKI